MSRYGRPIGAKELKVGSDKVSIEKLQVDVVAGLDLSVAAETEMPGTLVTRIDTKAQLTKNYQVNRQIHGRLSKYWVEKGNIMMGFL